MGPRAGLGMLEKRKVSCLCKVHLKGGLVWVFLSYLSRQVALVGVAIKQDRFLCFAI